MAFSNYSDLQAAVSNWLSRGDLAGEAADFITLGEAGLNRELDAVETDATITGTVGSRRIDITSLACVEPVALFLAQDGCDEIQLTPKTDGTFAYLDSSGIPRYWALDGEAIDFDRPLDMAYPFRFRYRQRFELSDASPTNWLLTNHPDLYLAAALVWGGVFIQDPSPAAARWVGILSTALPSVRNSIAQKKRALATVDPTMPTAGRYSYDYRNDI